MSLSDILFPQTPTTLRGISMLEVIRGLVPSLVRTITPWLVGLGVALLLKVGIEWTPSPEAFVFVSGAISTVFYAAVRWLETRLSVRWGWLLGSPTPPIYVTPAEKAIEPLAVGTTYVRTTSLDDHEVEPADEEQLGKFLEGVAEDEGQLGLYEEPR